MDDRIKLPSDISDVEVEILTKIAEKSRRHKERLEEEKERKRSETLSLMNAKGSF